MNKNCRSNETESRVWQGWRGVSRVALLVAFVLLALGGAVLAAAPPAAAQSETPGQTLPPEGTPIFLPLVVGPLLTPTVAPTPTPARTFGSMTVGGGSLGWPAHDSPDVNLSWRGSAPTNAYLGLVNYNGDTDDQAPQMAGIFSPPRLPAFVAAHQVYDWNWACNPPQGCRGGLLTWPYAVTMLELGSTPGEPLAIASRIPSVAGDYKAMVLYAEASRLTVTYTHDDSPVNGYLLHFEDVAVAPELVALYQQLDAAGRKQLPALRNGELWGWAVGGTVKVAIRDTGMFMDPRACKDWWVDYRSQCTAQLYRPAWARPSHAASLP